MSVRDQVRRLPGVPGAYRRARRLQRDGVDRVLRGLTYERLPPAAAVRFVYEILLRRQPDRMGFEDNLSQLASGALTRTELAEAVRGSEEFQTLGFTGRMLGASIHAGRCAFIRSLPRAARIVDLGGTHLARDVGAMVALGYPYPFEELTIIDLPSDDRHEIYRSSDRPNRVETPLGPVTYRYHSMTDLSGFADSSVDLVYSGQSIEHVTPAEGALVLKDAYRLLRPGGYVAIDTPNGTVTRLMQEDLIDPDHKVEYSWPELRELIEGAGFEVVSESGLNYGGKFVASGKFDLDEVARNWGLHADLEACYILAVVARKPHEA